MLKGKGARSRQRVSSRHAIPLVICNTKFDYSFSLTQLWLGVGDSSADLTVSTVRSDHDRVAVTSR